MIQTIKNLFQQIKQALTAFWDKPFSIQYAEDPVDIPKKKVLYIIGAKDEPWLIEIICPCGCKDKIVLPINDETSPRWNLTIDGGNLPSLQPSVWRSKGCKAHFFLKHGKIRWV